MTTATADNQELSAEAFEILRSAVNIARNEGTRTVAVLRQKLLHHYPGRDAQVQEALAYWANYEAGKGHHAA